MTLGEQELIDKFGGYRGDTWVPPLACHRMPHLFARRCFVSGGLKYPHACVESLGHRDWGTPHRCTCERTWSDRQLRRARRALRRFLGKKDPSWWKCHTRNWDTSPVDPDDEDDWEASIW